MDEIKTRLAQKKAQLGNQVENEAKRIGEECLSAPPNIRSKTFAMGSNIKDVEKLLNEVGFNTMVYYGDGIGDPNTLTVSW